MSNPIRVAVDARRLQDQPLTGVGRRLANLLPLLADEVDLILLTDRRRPPISLPIDQVPVAGMGPLPEPFWLHVGVSRWLRRFDGVFHGTYNALPLAYRGPSVVTIHDLSWDLHPEDFTRARRVAGATQARWAARQASVVVTVSEHARRSIVDTYGIDANRIVVAPASADPVFSPARARAAPPILARLGVRQPYVVALGGAPRRGLAVAVGAWRRLPTAGRPQLVVVGAEPPAAEDGIVHAGRVDDATWSALLAGATAFCYPTRFEGFGMPALEAVASGVPVVCGRVGPLPDILGEAAEWCPTPTVDEVAQALQRVLCDPRRQAQLRQLGVACAAAAPTWTDSAAVIAAAYRRAYR